MKFSSVAAVLTAALVLAVRPAAGQALVAHADFPALTPATAMLQATLSKPAQAWLCWGRVNGGTNRALWEHSLPLGNRPAGILSLSLLSLIHI